MAAPSAPTVLPRSVLADGRSLRWRSTGSGPPVVLVHGVAGSWRWWRPVLADLAAEHTVHLIDLPGFGELPRPHRVDLDATLAWLVSWAEAAEIGPAAYVGHSLGGLLCARLAARHPELVSRLALVTPAGVPGRGITGSAVSLAQALLRSRPAFLALLARDAVRAGPVAIGSAALAVVAADLSTDLPNVRVPTLVLMGGRDALIPAWHGHELARPIPGARVHVIEAAGHVPMTDTPAELSRELLAFLRAEP